MNLSICKSCKCLICFSHLIYIKFFLKCITCFICCFYELSGKKLWKCCSFLTSSWVKYPTCSKKKLPFRFYFLWDLKYRTSDSLRPYFYTWHNIFKCLKENGFRIFMSFRFNFSECLTHQVTCKWLFSIKHDIIDKFINHVLIISFLYHRNMLSINKVCYWKIFSKQRLLQKT